ncbi:hypothetical protein ORI20_01330 [Mycobacterium sp. CVI_P3]|uniref:Secreted protein n=1 Tax=Mycobacterium pinniadriaticum TaxID=2994102 RepID=A0ABT3S6W3_9MYCO|nr:hypothetical protein [Mycobacterium pinniadriaticum]MCX2928897.1 hypothetical protein [Mycobacterium pinniadriaticum]MCX2935236.1 hypothetical protein [Mycobacterium pinniadriaticum]
MPTLAGRWAAAFLTVSVATAGLVTASPARADCVSGGGSTVCAQGDVRGADGPPMSTGPYVPYPCDYDPYCYNGGLSIILDPGDGPKPPPPRPRPPRPRPSPRN